MYRADLLSDRRQPSSLYNTAASDTRAGHEGVVQLVVGPSYISTPAAAPGRRVPRALDRTAREIVTLMSGKGAEDYRRSRSG